MRVPGSITLKDTATTIAAAKAGIGLAYVLESRVQAELTEGTLINVMPMHSAYGDPFHMYYSSRRYVHPALRELINIIRTNNGLQSLPDLPHEKQNCQQGNFR
jgi:DNA-binding transcriptional LysR family regulator